MKQIIEEHYCFLLNALAKEQDGIKRAALTDSLQATELKLRSLFGYTDADFAEIKGSLVSVAN